jgi:hypothetical protein
LKSHGKPVSIGEVLGAIWQIYRAAMEHRSRNSTQKISFPLVASHVCCGSQQTKGDGVGAGCCPRGTVAEDRLKTGVKCQPQIVPARESLLNTCRLGGDVSRRQSREV